MAPRPRLLLLQLCAVAAASCLLAASCPVDAGLPPPPPTRDASSTANATDAAAAAVSRGARRLGPPHRLRVLSDIPADAPAAAADDYDYDMPADAPAAAAGDYDYDIPADADAPAPVAGADDIPADAAADQSLWTVINVAFAILLFFFAAYVVAFLVAGLVKGAAMLASAVVDLYAAAKMAHEKATRVRPVGQDAVEAAGH